MPPEPDLSIIIVNWNTRHLVGECLQSILAHVGDLSAEVIVIDNASTDGSAQMIAEEFGTVHLVVNDTNRGFAAANNLGLRIARGRYALLLNPDTVVLGDVLPATVAWADAHPDAGVVGCQVMQGADDVQRTCFRFPSPLNTLLWLSGLSARLPRSRIAGRAAYGPWDRGCRREVDVVSGMFMLVRREAIAQVGLMDERFFVFAEEADWCRRFRDAGWRCVFAPVGRILHVDGGSKSTEQAAVSMYLHMQRGHLRFIRKHRGAVAAGLTWAMFAGFMVARTLWWRLCVQLGAGEQAAHKARLSAAAAKFHLTGVEPDPAEGSAFGLRDSGNKNGLSAPSAIHGS